MTERSSTRVWEAKARFKSVLRHISDHETGKIFAEAALPAYAHGNPLIERLFWGRLRVVERYVAKNRGRPLK